MKNIIKYLLVAWAFALCMTPVYAFSYDNLSPSKQPTGFRGIFWESGKNHHLDLFSVFDNVDGVETFNRECDLLTLGSARLSEIRYHFYQNKFYQVSLILDNEVDHKALLGELTNEFGTPEEKSGTYVWENDTVSICLYPDGAIISYLPILNEINDKY
ncbi:MAG: hypothetical protein GX654_18090 [Desulfatiglans sp.]|jgi:hypothetical protein|nr:hypothetical protein [Desulfatiglans sp.]